MNYQIIKFQLIIALIYILKTFQIKKHVEIKKKNRGMLHQTPEEICFLTKTYSQFWGLILNEQIVLSAVIVGYDEKMRHP